MALPAVKRLPNVEDYFSAETDSDVKHEYHDGEILAMAGGTFEHSAINTNVTGELRQRLKGQPCQVLESNMRVRPGRASRYIYPDGTVVCGGPQFDPDDRRRTTITNPKVIVEVLSPSTEVYDRGEKFTLYRESPTLEEYVLVSQARPAVEAYHRQPDGTWSFAAWSGIEAVARLRSLDVDLPLNEVYAGVTFEEPPAAE